MPLVHGPDGTQYGDLGLSTQRSPCSDPSSALSHHLSQPPPDGLYPSRGTTADYTARHFSQSQAHPEMTVDTW